MTVIADDLITVYVMGMSETAEDVLIRPEDGEVLQTRRRTVEV